MRLGFCVQLVAFRIQTQTPDEGRVACALLSLDGGTGAKLRADVAVSACLGSAHVLSTIAGRIVRLSNRPSSDSDSLRVECISVRRPPTQCRSASVACRRVRSQRPALVAADSATLAEKQGSKAVSHRATGWLLFSEWRNEEHASVGFNK